MILFDLLNELFIREPWRTLTINAPSAIRIGFAGAQNPLQN